jgi:exopolyphosphatase/guanosine-5'-triphosphate,3'-diphosphate pyrophosphatase
MNEQVEAAQSRPNPQAVRRAVIDIGTNSIKLLVADVLGQEVIPVWEESHQTRLGAGFFKTRILEPERIQATAETAARFASAAREKGAVSLRAVATSAARDAVNVLDLKRAIEAAAGVRTEVISGKQEALLAYEGACTDPAFAHAPLLLLDLGGGSTEFILGHAGQVQFAHSFPLGTVRLMESIPWGDPPTPSEYQRCREWLLHFLESHVKPKLEPALRKEATAFEGQEIQLVGTGGTPSLLGCMELKLTRFDRAELEKVRLSRERLKWHDEYLWSLRFAERQLVIGLPPNRADVILAGVSIYRAIAEVFDFPELRVSTRGLRFAAVRSDGAVNNDPAGGLPMPIPA